MNQDWFEMKDLRGRNLTNSVWIPLRAIQQIEEDGRSGFEGYRSEFYGVGTLAVPLKQSAEARKLGWMDIGISHSHSGYSEKRKYYPVDTYKHFQEKVSGIHLVLDQHFNGTDPKEWHLHQDLVITLGLKREGDSWVRPDEGYIEVARLLRKEEGQPCLIEFRALHLKDYMCARGMGLYVTSYRQRVEVKRETNQITWKDGRSEEKTETDEWSGYVSAIHAGGMPFGEEWAVFHVARTDVDKQEDVPVMGLPTDGNVKSESWTKKPVGEKLYRVTGEFWRNEWIEPAPRSPIVRGDKTEPSTAFIIDEKGNQESAKSLKGGGRWLWFRPEVMPALAHRRGGSLGWYTRDTGSVACSPDDGVHFGVNSIGLVTVYAKDIALLPEWQQKIWAGYNVSPEGKVSEELLASQADAEPADTKAPEEYLPKALSSLSRICKSMLGISILRQHEELPRLFSRVHRFRATDQPGLFALAKDLARVTVDSIDASELQKIVAPPKGVKWGSLKSLENVLSTKIGKDHARKLMGPLVGIYELRLADAHLGGTKLNEALALAEIDSKAPYVIQGYQLLNTCVGRVYDICKVINSTEKDK